MTTQKKVLITGCSSGIGLSAANHLKSQDFHVITSVRQEQDIDALQTLGHECIQLDLSSTDSIQAAVQYIKENHSDIYGLVNNGAYGQPGAVEDLSREALLTQFETNVFGTHELTQAIVPLLRENGEGRVIQVSSVLGFIGAPMRGAYCASKYALEALTDTQRLELMNTNIKFSLIQPGPIETKFRANCYPYFQRFIDIDNSRYADTYKEVTRRLLRKENAKFTLPAIDVSKDILHALTSKNPKVRYRITTPTKMAAILKRLFTDKGLDNFINKHAN